MNNSDIERIEKELKVQLPEVYKGFLKAFPKELPADCDDGVYGNADVIIKATKGTRDYKEDEWESSYPLDCIDIGWDGGDGIFCIKEKDETGTVFVWDHEWGGFNPDETTTIAELVKRHIELIQDEDDLV